MTAKEPMWGTGTSTPDGYALRDSEVVLRLLLPAQVTGVADRVPWRTVARAFGDVTRVDGYTSWVELTELSGHGGTAPPQGYRPPAGYLDTDTDAETSTRLPDTVLLNSLTLSSRPEGGLVSGAPLVLHPEAPTAVHVVPPRARFRTGLDDRRAGRYRRPKLR